MFLMCKMFFFFGGGGGGGMFEILRKRENVGFGVFQKLKYEVNN